MSDSTWNDPRITAYVLDELSEEERQEFEAEFAGNAEMEAAVAEARTVTGQLEDLFAAEETPTLDRDRRSTIVMPAPSGRSWRTPMIALATAASLLLLIGGPMWFSRQQPIIVGQVATDAKLESYGMEAAKGTAVPSTQYSDSFATTNSNARELVLESDSESNFVRGTAELLKKEESRSSGDVPRSIRNRSRMARVPNYAPSPGQGQGVQGGTNIIYEADAKKPKSRTAERRFVESLKNPGQRIGEARAAFGAEDVELGLTRVDKDLIPLMVEKSRMEAEYGKEHPRVKALAGRVDVLRKELQSIVEAQTDRIALLDANRRSLGIGPGAPGDKFEPITDNPFKRVAEHAVSTFSVDVDTASYSKTRDFLTRAHQLPRPDAVRIEELVNYFNYDYKPPTADDEHPFTTHTVVTSCPWNPEHRLARIALKGKVMDNKERPRCNLVFLLDTSGSMNQPNKLPLVVEGMKMLLKQLGKKDRVAITVYAGSAGLVLDSTPAKKKKKIRNALTQLGAGGSTNGGAGIALAYQTARDNFIEDGVNRVILCTDGDFNVGMTGTDSLVKMVETEAKGGIFLSVLGFGMGNHNDAMLEQISGRGNGNYAFIDNRKEAHKVLVEQTSATLVTIAKDVKLQIEFNPTQVSSYRLIGYENRVLAKEDFNDDKKDAGEIGAGHAVTALYEIVPAGVEADESRPTVDSLKYQSEPTATDAADSNEMMTLKLRYKAPDGDTSTLIEIPVTDDDIDFDEADKDVRFAAAVAGFGMQLRRSDYKGTWTLSDVQSVAEKAKGKDESGLRTEFIELVRKASELMGQE